MKVGFLNNQIDNRGTGNATYDYAHYNETLLGNSSTIYTFVQGTHDAGSTARFLDRFGEIRYISSLREVSDVDVLYHIKYGNDEGQRPREGIIYASHAVFTVQHHGDRYAAISNWLAAGRVPTVPHIVQVGRSDQDLRESLGIPKDAIVFGRYGGADTFDIPWVWDAITDTLNYRDDIWFLFANTNVGAKANHIVYKEQILGPEEKSIFINTCDYMLHARHRGETFGISVGEFASRGRPVLTWEDSGEKAHLYELSGAGLLYKNQQHLTGMLKFLKKPYLNYAYTEYQPIPVMEQFEKVFLR